MPSLKPLMTMLFFMSIVMLSDVSKLMNDQEFYFAVTVFLVSSLDLFLFENSWIYDLARYLKEKLNNVDQYSLRLFCAFVFIMMFLIFFWPTIFKYEKVKTNRYEVLVRINRITGNASMFYGNSWKPIKE
jgi:hypothetical protein